MKQSMKQDMIFHSRWVLITGASSGLGKALALELARKHQANLFLVARRIRHLQVLKIEIETETSVKCHVIAADLAKPADVERVYKEAIKIGEIYGVVLNAGVTHFGKHLDLDWQDFQQMLAVNVTSVIRLMNLFSLYLIEKNQSGGIMVTSSMAGLLPLPYQAAYSGTKAFVTNFSQSLAQELHAENISITVFSPGGIRTEMTHNSKLRYFEKSPMLQDVESCASDALVAMTTRQTFSVPGMLNKSQLFLTRFMPRSLVGFVTQSAYRKALGET